MTRPKEVTDRFWSLFESDRLEELGALMAPDCDFKMPGTELHGRAPVLQMLRGYRTAFPDLRHEVKHHVESDDTIAIELEVTGTHTGPMQTPQGEVPATNQRVVWESCDFIRVSNGTITSWHVYHDPAPFLRALGVVP